MRYIITFFEDPNVRNVLIGSLLLTVSASVVGCFTFLRKRALVGDAIAHSVLPGICLAFIISGSKDLYFILPGAFLTGWLSVIFMNFITNHTKIKEDTAIGLILSVFFGVGILLLTYIQHGANASQSGLDHFIFGKAASLLQSDVYILGGIGIFIPLIILLFYKQFSMISFDKNFAVSIGIPVNVYEFILTSLTVFSVVAGIQAVGVVLMTAMLITPAATARFWTNRLSVMIFLAACIGGVAGISGAIISYVLPSMPTGPWIVVVVSFFAIISFLFAPTKGIVPRTIRKRKNKSKILEENILKAMYHLAEKEKDYFSLRSLEEILKRRIIEPAQLNNGLNALKKLGYVKKNRNHWMLTPKGKDRGLRVTKLHRLWEMYLTHYVRLAPDHVHDDAETIEHIITPELERRIEEQLGYPLQDPHQMEIPYSEKTYE